MPAAHKQLDQLASTFFRTFARAEYALKASGFNNGEGAAEANWRKFALEVEELIAHPQDQSLEAAIGFYFDAPPKKQVIREGVITWEVSPPKTNSRADALLVYVRRVRNNLFHGGKFNGRWFEPERSEPLLRHGLVILSACMESVGAVREAYHG